MEPLKQLLDSTVSFTQMTRERAEAIVAELVREGQVRTEEYQRNVQELVDRSRESAERFNEMVRAQVVKVLTTRIEPTDSNDATVTPETIAISR